MSRTEDEDLLAQINHITGLPLMYIRQVLLALEKIENIKKRDDDNEELLKTLPE